MRGVSKLRGGVAGAVIVTALAGCGGGSGQPGEPGDTPSAAGAKGPSDGSVLVRYELTGTAVSVDGTYAEPADGRENMVQLKATPLPWRKTFTLPPSHLFVAGLVAQGPNLETSITCKIMKDSEVVAQETGPTVDCRAEIAPTPPAR